MDGVKVQSRLLVFDLHDLAEQLEGLETALKPHCQSEGAAEQLRSGLNNLRGRIDRMLGIVAELSREANT